MDTNFDIITFDCYGTLIDWEGGIRNAFLNTIDSNLSPEQLNQIVDAYMQFEPLVEGGAYLSYREVQAAVARRIAAQFNWSLSDSQINFISDSLPNWQPFADTNQALARLAKRYQLGLLSNIDDDLLAATRRHFTVQFDLIITAQQLHSYKPGHPHFTTARERLTGKRWLHAAQSHFHDVVPCRELDIPVVWVNRKNEQLSDAAVRPTAQVKDLAGLAELLGV